MYRYDVYPSHRPETGSARGQKSLAGGCPFHASSLRDTDHVSGEGNGVRSKWLEGVNSLFKNLQASLNNHISIKDG
jgi:hypothetical protein